MSQTAVEIQKEMPKDASASVIAQHEIEHADEEIRILGGMAQGLRADPRLGQEQAQPLGIAGNEGQRLNRNDFSDFARVLNRLFQTERLPFR